MKKLFFLSVVALLLIACNDNVEQTDIIETGLRFEAKSENIAIQSGQKESLQQIIDAISDKDGVISLEISGIFTKDDWKLISSLNKDLPALEELILNDVPSFPDNAFFTIQNDSNRWLRKITAPNARIIGENAFRNCIALESAVFSENVSTIGTYAFGNCDKLQSISFPFIYSLPEKAFFNCKSLVNIDLPRVTKLGEYCFSGCSSLNFVSLKKVTNIESSAFLGCISLINVDIPSISSMKYSCFDECPLLDLSFAKDFYNIPDGSFRGCKVSVLDFKNTRKIGAYAFANSAVREVVMPELSSLSNYSFSYCINLEYVSIANVSYLGRSAFWGCTSLGEVILSNVDWLYSGTFFTCEALDKVSLASKYKPIEKIEEEAFYKTENIVLYLDELNFADAVGNKWQGFTWKEIHKQ